MFNSKTVRCHFFTMTKLNSSPIQTTPSAGWFLHALLSKRKPHYTTEKASKSKLVNQIGLPKIRKFVEPPNI